MYPISSAVRALFDSNQKQIIRITLDDENTTYTITESDIILGSFSIDRYSITGNRIEIGTACASECKFKLKNYEGEWNNVTFEGAQLYVQIGIADWANYTSVSDITWIPCGYFVVDAPVKNASILSVSALDRMAKLDKVVDWTQVTGTQTPSSLINHIATKCGVVVADGSSIANLPNASYHCAIPSDRTDFTYRNLLQSACMLMGVCAFFNESGSLKLKWYTTASISSQTVSIDESKRYNHEINENDVEITGVYCVKDDDSGESHAYLSGTTDYAIDISDNPLIGDNVSSLVSALGTALIGFRYRPVKATVKPSPYLYPLDLLSFVKEGTTYTVIVSNITFGVNCNTVIEGRGETEQDNGYATYGNFTQVQSRIIELTKNKVSKVINERTALLLNLNEMITNSLGLYETTIQTQGGGYQYYFHDKSTLATSTIIYTMNAGGFAWTDNWNNGNPVWHYGITRDGNAIVNILSAYKISADIITAGTMSAVNLIFGTSPNTTELRTNDASTGALFEGTGVMQFKTRGAFTVTNLQNASQTANSITAQANLTKTVNNATVTYNRTQIYNSRDGKASNALILYGGTDTNECSIENDSLNGSGTNLVSNKIYMTAKHGSNRYLQIYNNNENNYTANRMRLDATNYPYIYITNFQKDNNGTNYVASNIYLKQTSDINSFDFYNNRKSSNTDLQTATANHQAMYAWETNSKNVYRVDNYHWNKNIGNYFQMQSTSNSSSISLVNNNSSGSEKTGLYMNSDGSFLLRTNTGGTSKIEVHTNGNLDVIGSNVVYLGQQRGSGYLSLASKNHRGDVYWSKVSDVGNDKYVLIADGVVYEGKS